jgi:hypothetical protein
MNRKTNDSQQLPADKGPNPTSIQEATPLMPKPVKSEPYSVPTRKSADSRAYAAFGNY